MPYVTQAGFERSFGVSELTQLLADRPDGFAQVASEADSEVNSYLAGRYALPLSDTPSRLTAVALDIARYRLYDDAGDDQSVWVRRYKDALQWLRDLSVGRTLLTDALGVVLSGPLVGNMGLSGPVIGLRKLVYGPEFEDAYRQLEPVRYTEIGP